MRVIKVRNASIFATIGNKTIDVEIRSTKDSYQGVCVNIEGNDHKMKEVFNWQLAEPNVTRKNRKSLGEPIIKGDNNE